MAVLVHPAGDDGAQGEGQADTAILAEAFDMMAERMEAVQAVLERRETARAGADDRLADLIAALTDRMATMRPTRRLTASPMGRTASSP